MTLQVIIPYILQHMPAELLVAAWIIGAYKAYIKHQSPNEILAWLLLLPVGIAGVWGFMFHAFLPNIADKLIGWAYSPFEFEVAVANLGMGILGIFSFRASLGFRKAAVLFCTVFLWGAAFGHIYQMIAHHNFDPGNAGFIFWTDLLIPASLIMGLRLSKEV